jgi:hypothetical protein
MIEGQAMPKAEGATDQLPTTEQEEGKERPSTVDGGQPTGGEVDEEQKDSDES